MKNGWHTVMGYEVLIEDDKVIRGTLGSGTSYRAAYPYKHYKGYSGWHNVAGKLTVSAFRYGVKNGSVMMS